MKNILLATDGSPSAEKATDVAIELAGALDATLRIVAVWHFPTYDYGYAPIVYVPELGEAQRDGAEKAVAKAAARAKAAGVHATGGVSEGRAAEEICALAEADTPEMIVLGAHGWGGVKRVLFGSVSTAVLHHAVCPVLVVRGDVDQRDGELAGAAVQSAH
jgi:nucleotide-binding universal stress UspA family protein